MIKPVSPFYPVQLLQTLLAAVLFAGMGCTALAALGFEHIGGLMPCRLCLMDRVPYYTGAPLMLAATVLSVLRVPGIYVRGLFLAVFLLMIYSLLLSVYHAGVEWKFWPGPSDCSSAALSLPENADDLLGSLNTIRPVSCSEAAGYFLGLSMAGWNAVASFGYAVLAAFAACCHDQQAIAFVGCLFFKAGDCFLQPCDFPSGFFFLAEDFSKNCDITLDIFQIMAVTDSQVDGWRNAGKFPGIRAVSGLR